MSDSKDKVFDFTCIIDREVFSSEDFKIYGVEVNTDTYPDVKLNKYGNATIVGNCHKLTEGVQYHVRATEGDSKYGKQYEILNIKRDIPTDKMETEQFLREVITENQANVLLEVYPDIVDRVMSNNLDDIDLNLTKGIKQATFNKIKEKIIENFALVEVVEKYGGYGLSMSVLKKLYEEYSSIERLEEALKSDPYKSLCKISGIGFKKADNIILSIPSNVLGLDDGVKTSRQRMLSAMHYILEENEKDGHTKMNILDFRKECMELTPEAINSFVDIIKEDEHFYFNAEDGIIASKQAYETELYIANKLKSMLKHNRAYKFNYIAYQDDGDIQLTDEQLSALGNLCKYNVSLLAGAAGCVDKDTEFFDGSGWKSINKYKIGDKVLQYNEDGTTQLVEPVEYHKYPAKYLTHIKNKSGRIDQILSDEHNVVYRTSKGNINKISAKEMIDRQNKKPYGFRGKFITSYKYNGEGIDLTDDEIRLMVAVIADGSFYGLEDICRFHIKKEDKKERLIKLLKATRSSYKITDSAEDGYNDFYLYDAPRAERAFSPYWYNCSQEQLEVIVDEVLYWDGSIDLKGRKSFSTVIKASADFIQFAATACGYTSNIKTYDRTGEEYLTAGKIYIRQSIEYDVGISKRKNVAVSLASRTPDKKLNIIHNNYKTKDGHKYCFTVPSGMLVLRCNDRIFVTGNSGKSKTVSSIIKMLQDNGLKSVLLAPTGRASNVLQGYAGEGAEASTIHRGLGYNPELKEKWLFNEKNQLDCDVVIVDETGMVDIYLFKRLLMAINPNKTKILMIQDPAQLPSVSAGNCSDDMIKSDTIATTHLTQIFRYGEGGLYNVATKVRKGEYYIPKDARGVTNFGENKDYSVIDMDQESMVDGIINLYETLINKGETPDDIAVLSHHNKGDYGSMVLNNAIQKRINPITEGIKYLKSGSINFIIGDKVLQVVNNYKAENIHGEEVQIFNGNTGIVKDIDIKAEEAVVDFDGVLIKYKKDELGQLMLGYAMSIHKMQGGSSKIVIVITPRAHTYFLNRNLIYTAITRTREKCYHFSSKKTIASAIKKSIPRQRKTFLQGLLEDSK